MTIGLPVYNGGARLKTAIDSLGSQSYRDFILHISDNASTDETPLICRAAAETEELFTRGNLKTSARPMLWLTKLAFLEAKSDIRR
jgi:glycosyltransferase involved in cell wall biosynthesis